MGRVQGLCLGLSRDARKGRRTGVQERSWGMGSVPTEGGLGRTVPVLQHRQSRVNTTVPSAWPHRLVPPHLAEPLLN